MLTHKGGICYSGKYKIVTRVFRSSKLLGKENMYVRKLKQYKTLSEILYPQLYPTSPIYILRYDQSFLSKMKILS